MDSMTLVKDNLAALQETERELYRALQKCQKAEIALGGEPMHTLSGTGTPTRATSTPPRRSSGSPSNGGATHEQALETFRAWGGGNQSEFARKIGVARGTAKRYLDDFVKQGHARTTGTGTRKRWLPITVGANL